MTTHRLTIDFSSDGFVTTWDMAGAAAPAFIALAMEDMDQANVTSFKLERIEGGEAVAMPHCKTETVWSVKDQHALVASADRA